MKCSEKAPVRRLNTKTLFNARDLGGYPTADGKVTKYKVFVRSEVPHGVSQEDIQYLLDYGVAATADFRGSWEISKQPSDLAELLPYYHRPIFDDAGPPDIDFEKIAKMTILDQYMDMVETGKAWAKKMMELAASQKGILLYHCAIGKDRTGIMSCLLLSIAGVSREDIAADYCISAVLLGPVMKNAFQNNDDPNGPFGKDKPMPKIENSEFNSSPATAMLDLLDYFDKKYGGVMGYLREIGVTDDTIARIREKFLEDA